MGSRGSATSVKKYCKNDEYSGAKTPEREMDQCLKNTELKDSFSEFFSGFLFISSS